MDSLTQIALGGAVGAVIGGKKYGKKAALVGAFCGTVPDLDTFFFINSDPVTTFTYHRGFSHSIIFCLLATPIFAWVFSKIKWFAASFKDKKIHLLIFLTFLTHIILDGITIYGTQIFWPLSTPPVGIGSIFIIDPLYTLPLLIALTWFLINRNTQPVKIALIISTAYLIWGFAAQNHVKNIAQAYLNIHQDKILVQTTPFNTLLWRILVMKKDGYEVGYYSLFDKSKDIAFKKYDSDPKLLEPIKESFAVSRLEWFTKGFYTVKEVDNKIIMIDLRMGLEPNNYVFGFIVGEHASPTKEIPTQRYQTERGMNRLSKIWARIWDESVDI